MRYPAQRTKTPVLEASLYLFFGKEVVAGGTSQHGGAWGDV